MGKKFFAVLHRNGRAIHPDDLPLVSVEFADRCAWRAIYIRVLRTPKELGYTIDHQIFHLGIDPDLPRAAIFGAFTPFFKGPSLHWRIRVPFTRWAPSRKTGKQSALRSKWQRWVGGLDGRYGRAAQKRKAATT